MKTKIIFIASFLFISLFFCFIKTEKSYAQFTAVEFIDNNDGTNWGVRAYYNAHNPDTDVGWITVWTEASNNGFGIPPPYTPKAADTVTWFTACVDPTVPYYPTQEGFVPGLGANVYLMRINATCKQGQGGIYAACDNPDNKGAVNWNDICPGTPDCATRGLLEICGGANFCGSGGNVCNLRDEFCNFNNSFGNWCVRRTIRNNDPNCVGVNGCCFNDSQCNSNQYCAGSNQCTNYAHIGGRVYIDENTNGAWDPGPDSGRANTQVERRPASSSVWTDGQVTVGGGRYSFDRLRNPSDHDVHIINPNTCALSIASANPRNNITATPNQDDIDFRLVRQIYVISGTVYRDTNFNGVLEYGIDPPHINDPGTIIRVVGENRNDRLNPANGNYWINGNIRGNYAIAMSDLPSGWYVVGSNQKNVTIDCANSTGNDFLITRIPVAAVPPPPLLPPIGSNPEDLPPPIVPPPPSTYSISGGVFDDVDGNGLKSAGEAYLAGLINISGQPNFFISDINGFSATGLPEGSYTVTYANPPLASIFTVSFPNGSAYFLTIGPGCAFAGGNTTCSAGNILNVNFGLAVIPRDPWFQGIGGDLRADHGLTNLIPPLEFFSYSNNSLSPGVVFGSLLNLGGGNVSPNGWLVTNTKYASSQVKTSYAYVDDSIKKGGLSSTIIPYSGSGLPANKGIYRSSGDITISTGGPFTFGANSDYVFLINGNLTIANNLIVPTSSTVIFIVRGNITVNSNVTRIDGIYSADNNFTVQGVPVPPDLQLVIQGNVIANAGQNTTPATFVNNRDLTSRANWTVPSVQFVFRPDFILNAPDLIRYSNYTVKEAAPGP